MEKLFHEELKDQMDKFAHLVYSFTKNFPKEELYGLTSQLRRASLSVVLNYIEGYARMRSKLHKNFLEISYGLLKEAKYLIDFAFTEQYLSKDDHDKAILLSEKIGAMLWGILRKI